MWANSRCAMQVHITVTPAEGGCIRGEHLHRNSVHPLCLHLHDLLRSIYVFHFLLHRADKSRFACQCVMPAMPTMVACLNYQQGSQYDFTTTGQEPPPSLSYSENFDDTLLIVSITPPTSTIPSRLAYLSYFNITPHHPSICKIYHRVILTASRSAQNGYPSRGHQRCPRRCDCQDQQDYRPRMLFTFCDSSC